MLLEDLFPVLPKKFPTNRTHTLHVKIHQEKSFPQSDLIPSKSYSQGVYNLDKAASKAHLERSYLFENVRSSAHNPDTQIIDEKRINAFHWLSSPL